MGEPPSSVWIKFKVSSEEALGTARRLARSFEMAGVRVYLDPLLARLLELPDKTLKETSIADTVDMAVVVGGDGTLLRLFQSTGGNLPLVLGINSDRIGFLYDFDWRFAEELVKKIVSGDFWVEERSTGLARFLGYEMCFVSEIAIGGRVNFKMARLEVYVDGEFLYKGRMDGLIVSTTTGSSAYAFSAGGPFVDPSLDAIVVVPLAPFSPLLKPVILSPSRKITIRMLKDGALSLDGIVMHAVPLGTEIEVRLKPKGLKLVRVKGGLPLHRRLKARLLDLPPWAIEG